MEEREKSPRLLAPLATINRFIPVTGLVFRKRDGERERERESRRSENRADYRDNVWVRIPPFSLVSSSIHSTRIWPVSSRPVTRRTGLIWHLHSFIPLAHQTDVVKAKREREETKKKKKRDRMRAIET